MGQILSNIQDIYALQFPDQFKAFVNLIASLISLNIVLPALSCFGLSGFENRLILCTSSNASHVRRSLSLR